MSSALRAAAGVLRDLRLGWRIEGNGIVMIFIILAF